MSNAAEHYARHLAPVYLWMAGGADAALRSGELEIEALGLPRMRGDFILDLGAGFGMHAIPLARRGARVMAVDSSAELVCTLGELAGGLPVQAVNDDLLAFASHIAELPRAILCMGDTITHLPDFDAVEGLIKQAALALPRGGLFVVSLRDHALARAGDARFILVRGDEARLLTCFLEYEAQHVRVHDILHERTSSGWQCRVSHYPKLRLPPERLMATLESHGFKVRREAGIGGMVRLVAEMV